MRKRSAATGAGVVGIAAFGLWMFNGLDDFGLGGPGEGGGPSLTLDPTAGDADEVEPAPPFSTASERSAADPNAALPTVAPDDPTFGLGPAPENEDDAPPIAVADVLVDGAEYRVIRRFASDGRPIREPATLAEVLALAEAVPGSPDGLKVRVSRTPDAVAGAASDLMDGLRRAGLTEDQIDYRTRLVEDGGDGDPADPLE